MTLLIAFAFLAGVVTILSPCILPILPVVLSGSVTGGRKRPWGIVVGFISSFTFFTLFLSAIVRATGVSPDALRTVSVVIIGMFGLSLLIPWAQLLFERLFSRLASRASGGQQAREGFGGGVLIGLSLGLVWTPCVGPILASVISLALTGSVTGTAVIITAAYSLGTAIPMLGIAYGGRALLQKVPWLVRNSNTLQKIFGVLMVLVALAIQFNYDRKLQILVLEQFPQYGAGLTRFEDNDMVQKNLQALEAVPSPAFSVAGSEGGFAGGRGNNRLIAEDLGAAPELVPGGAWFNTEPLTLAQLHGKVVLIDFWTYTCINCVRTLPYLKAWHEQYADKGLVIIGVHTPEFEFEKNPSNVKSAIEDYELKYPVMQDNAYATWRAYANRYWPAHYFIDARGHIRRTHFGEGGYDESEKAIQALLEEAGQEVDDAASAVQDYTIDAGTPELYLGFGRIDHLVSPETIANDRFSAYSIPPDVPLHHFAYGGQWSIHSEYASPSAGARLVLRFEAKNVFLVIRPRTAGQAGTLRVFLDGSEVNGAGEAISVDHDQLYPLIQLPRPGGHTLELEFLDNNLELYAFTFG